jgi:hypothetical protein
MDRAYEEHAMSHPDSPPAPPKAAGDDGDDAGQFMSTLPAASGPGDSAPVSLFTDDAYTGSAHDLALPDGDLSAGVGLADQPSPDPLISPGWDPGDASFGVGLADDLAPGGSPAMPDPGFQSGDLSAGVGLADQPSPDPLMSPGWDPGDGSFGVGSADDTWSTRPEAGTDVSVIDPNHMLGFSGGSLDGLTEDESPAMTDPGFLSGGNGADDAVDPGTML